MTTVFDKVKDFKIIDFHTHPFISGKKDIGNPQHIFRIFGYG